MRRLSTIAAAVALIGLGVLGTAVTNAGADTTSSDTPAVRVVKLSGLLDPVVADFLDSTLADVSPADTLAIVLRVDSSGSVVSDGRLAGLARALHDAPVPVVAWVGPAGSHATGGTAQLLAVVDDIGLAPGSELGRIGAVVVPEELWSESFWDQRDQLRDGVMGSEEAAAAGIAMDPNDALVLRNVLVQIDGFHATEQGATPATPVQFSELSTTRTVLHTFASPAVVILLLAIGLSLLLFEFYTAGVGAAGLVGAGCLIYGSYGLAVLGARPLALVAVAVAMIAFAVDVQTGVPRVWTAIGSVLFAVGLLFVFDAVGTPWPATIGSIIGVIVFMVFGMPAMTRSRFSSPVIDRTWLIGQTGMVVDALGPDGVVRIDGALWAGRGTGDIPVSTAVRVVDTEGVVCRVEPVPAADGQGTGPIDTI